MAQPNTAANVKNVVLVHGGFVDGSGWEGVYKALKKEGYNVTVVQNPTTSLADDVAVTKRTLAAQDGPVIRVCGPGEVYADDDYVYWSFSGQGLEYLAALAGYERAEVVDAPIIDGHPRIMATLRAVKAGEGA